MSMKLCEICKGLFAEFRIDINRSELCNDCSDQIQKLYDSGRSEVIDTFISENKKV